MEPSNSGVFSIFRGAGQEGIADACDMRLDGTLTLRHDNHGYADGHAGHDGSFVIENEGGAWREAPALGLTYPDGSLASGISVFVGEGAYRGHVAIAEIVLDGDAWTVRGYVVEGELPRGSRQSRE